jgi:hypothetical protein
VNFTFTARRNGALIKQVGGRWFKMVWGLQFGFGVRHRAVIVRSSTQTRSH